MAGRSIVPEAGGQGTFCAALAAGLATAGHHVSVHALHPSDLTSWATATAGTGVASTGHTMQGQFTSGSRVAIPVECVRVDDFLGGRTANVIKMDIEGHELQALRGMEQTIDRSPGLVMMVEWSPARLRRQGAEPNDLPARLSALGFQVRLIDEIGRLLPATLDGAEAAEREETWYRNLYCVKT